MHDLMRGIWRKMPDFVRHSSLTRTLAANVQMAFLEMRMRSHGFRPNREKPPIKGPVVIGGFFRSASGIGEAARACYRALNAAGLSPLAVDLTEAITRVDLTPDIPLSKFPDDRSGTLLLYVNPPELLSAVAQLGFLKGRRWRIIG